jgi:phosphatidylglycerophosphate synthase
MPRRRIRQLTVGSWQANLTSIVGAAFCIGAGISLAFGGPILVAAILFPVGGLCDLADGAIARAANRDGCTNTGAFIDSMCDKIGEVALFLGIVIGIPDPTVTYLAATAFAFSSLASYAKAVAGEHRLGITWPEVRVFGRAGRVILLSAILFLEAFYGAQGYSIFAIGLGMLSIFNCASLLWRLKRVAGAST